MLLSSISMTNGSVYSEIKWSDQGTLLVTNITKTYAIFQE